MAIQFKNLVDVFEQRTGAVATDAYTLTVSTEQTSGATPNPGTGGLKVQYNDGTNDHGFGLVAGTSSSDFLTSGPMHFYTNSDLDTKNATGYAMMIDTSQQVTIGSTTADGKLSLNGGNFTIINTQPEIILKQTASTTKVSKIIAAAGSSQAPPTGEIAWQSGRVVSQQPPDGLSLKTYNPSTYATNEIFLPSQTFDNFAITLDNTSVLEIDPATGNVGVNIDNPLSKLHVYSTSNLRPSAWVTKELSGVNAASLSEAVYDKGVINLTSYDTSGTFVNIYGISKSTTADSEIFQAWTDIIDEGDNLVTRELSLNPFGSNVGIGTSNPGAKLDVEGNAVIGAAGNIVNGDFAVAINKNTVVTSEDGFAQGENTIATGRQAAAFGFNTYANGPASIAGGSLSETNAQRSIAVGATAITNAEDSAAFNTGTRANGLFSFATGQGCFATNNAAFATGSNTQATGLYSFSGGVNSIASGNGAVALGGGAQCSGEFSFAAGNINVASGINTTALGFDNDAIGAHSTVIGHLNTTSAAAAYGVAINFQNTVSGQAAFAFNQGNTVSGLNAAAGGVSNTVDAEGSFAYGFSNDTSGTGATPPQQILLGRFLKPPRDAAGNAGEAQIIVGRHNAHASVGATAFAVGTGTSTAATRSTLSVFYDNKVGIDTTSPQAKVDIDNVGTNGVGLRMSAGVNTQFAVGTDGTNNGVLRVYDNSGSQRIKLDSSSAPSQFWDDVSIGTNSNTQYRLYVENTTTTTTGNILGIKSLSSFTSTPGRIVDYINSSGTRVGGVVMYGSAVQYQTTSDYRIKENVQNLTGGIDKVKLLKPKAFNFIGESDRPVEGFIAHEVKEVAPSIVTGEKDAVDEFGDPLYQGLDQTGLIPILTSALKEAIEKIENLESRIQMLENNG